MDSNDSNKDGEMGHLCPPSVIKWLNSPIRKLIQNPRKIFRAYVRPGDTVVDLGCGGGFFSVALAEMVGTTGRVIAVDLQEKMLEITRKLARKKGILDRITLHRCEGNDLGLSGLQVDFALAFYMVHEIPDRNRFLRQVIAILKPEAKFMIIEPAHHVKPKEYQQMLQEARSAGLKPVEPVKVALSRGMVLGRV